LADTFDSMLERLEHAFESQKQFIQDASHELRTPIAIAQTNIEVLEMEGEATQEDYKQLVDVIKLSLKRMNDVNNNLLLLSEGTQTQSRWARVDMGKLLNEVYEETNAEARASSVNLEWKPPESKLFVCGDSMH
jgi:signal transduction histidine kinase